MKATAFLIYGGLLVTLPALPARGTEALTAGEDRVVHLLALALPLRPVAVIVVHTFGLVLTTVT